MCTTEYAIALSTARLKRSRRYNNMTMNSTRVNEAIMIVSIIHEAIGKSKAYEDVISNTSLEAKTDLTDNLNNLAILKRDVLDALSASDIDMLTFLSDVKAVVRNMGLQ